MLKPLVIVAAAVFLLWPQDVASCDMECLCESAGGVYAAESQSCLMLTSRHFSWWQAYEDCEELATQHNLSAIGAVGRLAHIETDQMAHTIYTAFKDMQLYIGLRSTKALNATILGDYAWWLSRTNSYARKAATDIANVTSKALSNTNDDCVFYDTTSNQWTAYLCKRSKTGLCEIFASQCDIADPCSAPKECVPDSQYQVFCVCPLGSPDDPNCGVTCTGKNDGDYAVGHCSTQYYTCSSGGSETLKTCTGTKVFDPFNRICASKALACRCIDLGWLYSVSTESCFTADMGVARRSLTWVPSFNYCKQKAAIIGVGKLWARLAHISSIAANALTLDVVGYKSLYMGMRTAPQQTNNGTSLEDYRWWLDPDNNNALLTVTNAEQHLLNSIDVSTKGADCVYQQHTATGNIWQDMSCAHTDSYVWCEMFYNQCELDDPCTPPKVCVPDVNRQALCFCPNDAVDTPDCTDCMGKPDGKYSVGTCRPDYYTCASGASTLDQCALGSKFDPYHKNCSETTLECKCIELGGKYMLSSQSCLLMRQWDASWYKHFEQCQTAAVDLFDMPHLYGRLAHVNSAQIAAAVLDIGELQNLAIGMRGSVESMGSTTELSDFGWWLDKDNPNAVDEVLEPDYIATVTLDGPHDDCMVYTATEENTWDDYRCTFGHYPICQIFHDQCQVSDPCVPPKVCVPDVLGAARCFCPAGAANKPDCGVDCTNKTDGIYSIGDSSKHFYTCVIGVATIESCMEYEIFHKHLNHCANDSVASKCMELGGKFAQTDSCIVALNKTTAWTQAFESCELLSSDKFGPGVRGRLVHLTSNPAASAIVDLVYDWVWTALRTEINSNYISDYSWWNQPDSSVDSALVTSNLTSLNLISEQNLQDLAHQCVMFHPSGIIQDEDCGQHQTALCEIFYEPADICVKEEPCRNNGSCIDHNPPIDGSYHCECTKEYAGTNCTDPNICLLESPCHNGENCTDGPGEEYTCACAPEMLDKNCSVTDWCYFRTCENGGSCILETNSSKCICPDEWMLPNCTQKAPTCPQITVKHCNGSSCFCKMVKPPKYTGRVEYREIGRDVRGSEGVTVQTHSQQSASHCAMVCTDVPKCSFFSFRHSSSECMLHENLVTALDDFGFKMFAKILV